MSRRVVENRLELLPIHWRICRVMVHRSRLPFPCAPTLFTANCFQRRIAGGSVQPARYTIEPSQGSGFAHQVNEDALGDILRQSDVAREDAQGGSINNVDMTMNEFLKRAL